MQKKEIQEIVISKVRALVETLPEEQQMDVNESTVLFGKGSAIDSLSLVSIIVDIESAFSLDHGSEISLTDDRAMTRKKSPFDSIASLIDYIDELINQGT
jgi:acyl carrier protein